MPKLPTLGKDSITPSQYKEKTLQIYPWWNGLFPKSPRPKKMKIITRMTLFSTKVERMDKP